MKPLDSVGPLAAIHKVIPFGNKVVDRTASVSLTEWGTAVHATGGLNRHFSGAMFEFVAFPKFPFDYNNSMERTHEFYCSCLQKFAKQSRSENTKIVNSLRTDLEQDLIHPSPLLYLRGGGRAQGFFHS